MDEKQIIIRSVLDDAWEHPFPHPRNRLFDTMADSHRADPQPHRPSRGEDLRRQVGAADIGGVGRE